MKARDTFTDAAGITLIHFYAYMKPHCHEVMEIFFKITKGGQRKAGKEERWNRA